MTLHMVLVCQSRREGKENHNTDELLGFSGIADIYQYLLK